MLFITPALQSSSVSNAEIKLRVQLVPDGQPDGCPIHHVKKVDMV